MSAFHFAFFVRDLDSTRRFYGEILGCREGRSTDTWVDFDFFGNQISAHNTGRVTPTQNTGKVEDILVPMPHFGAILGWDEFDAIAGRIRAAGMPFILEPRTRYRRAAGRAGDDVSPRPQRQRARVQELQAPGARVHGMMTASVAVIGGGVIGASVAYHLAARGWQDVVILDRGAGPGEGSTGRATGGFRAQYATRDQRASLPPRAGEARSLRGGDRAWTRATAQAGYLWLGDRRGAAGRAVATASEFSAPRG